jgi:hypothetical protein
MNAPHSPNAADENVLTIVILTVAGFAAVFYGIPYVYSHNKELFNSSMIALCRLLLLPVTYISSEAQYVSQAFAQRAPVTVPWVHVANLFGYVGSFYRWPVAALLLALAVRSWGLCISDRYRRKLDLKGLLLNNVDVFPALGPAVFRYRSILEESYDTGLWRTARQPIQFAVEHALLLNEGKVVAPDEVLLATGLANPNSRLLAKGANSQVRFDRMRAGQLCVAQLGSKFSGQDPFSLPDYQRGLLAAFLAFACGDKKAAQGLLDQMNRTFREEFEGRPGGIFWRSLRVVGVEFLYPVFRRRIPAQEFVIDVTGVDQLLKRHMRSEVYQAAVAQHGVYTSMVLVSLLASARRKGVLPPAQFLWLRPRDRTLWYTLHQVGGRQPWAEACGPWSHFQSEQALGEAIEEPEIQEAVDGLEAALYDDGWLPHPPKSMAGGAV